MSDGLRSVSFVVPGIPVAQPRQRHRVAKTKSGKAFARNYTPAKDPVNAFKATVRLSFPIGEPPFAGPVKMKAVFVMPRPNTKMWKKKPMPRYFHTSTPDLDNLIKSTKDALKAVAWRDDSQVAIVDAVKVVAAGDESPHVEIMISETDESSIPRCASAESSRLF